MRKTVHLTATTEQFFNARHAAHETPNFSAHINAAFEQLALIAETEKPDLSADEWAEIYNVYAGSDLTRPALPLNLAADLLAHYGATLPKQTPCPDLVYKLADFTQAQQLAIVDAARVFWASAE